MNLTNTLKRIDVFLGTADAALEEYHIEQAVAALTRRCDDLLTKALAESHTVLADEAGLLSQKDIDDAINEFLRTPEMTRMTRKAQAEVFKQVAAPYGKKCELFKAIRTANDSIYHQITTYDALYTALQTKYKDLLDE